MGLFGGVRMCIGVANKKLLGACLRVPVWQPCMQPQRRLQFVDALRRSFLSSLCRPVFCELSAKVPVGDGLSISPCAVFTHRGGASSLAYVMQSCWRF